MAEIKQATREIKKGFIGFALIFHARTRGYDRQMDDTAARHEIETMENGIESAGQKRERTREWVQSMGIPLEDAEQYEQVNWTGWNG
jgi:hypothetical protein